MATVENFIVKVDAQGLDKLDKVSSAAANASSKMNLLAASILGVGFGAFIQGAIAMADRMTDLSDATGLTVSSILNFSNALDQAGGKSKNAEKIILTFFNSMDTALGGSDKLRKSFEKLGISLDDLKTKSEQELLTQAIQGLAEMEKGATRTALAQDIFGKSMRAVEVDKFVQSLKDGKTSADEAAKGIIAGGDAADKMAKQFATLQQGALNAIEPIFKLFNGVGITVDTATKGFQILGAVMALAFGASMVANIIKINQALTITAGLTNLIGKSPLGLIAKLVLAGGAAAALSGDLEKLKEANDKLNESQNQSAAETARLLAAGKGPKAAREAAISPEDKMRLESAKNAAVAKANIDRDQALMSANELMAIRINADNEIAKTNLDFNLKEKETGIKFAEERAAKIKEINQKALLDEAKYRNQLNARVYSEEEAQRQKNREDTAAYEDRVAQAAAQALSQVNAIKKQGEELQGRFELQQKIVDLGTIEQDRQTKLFDLEQQRKQQLESISKIPNIQEPDRLAQVKELNAEYEKQATLINKIADERQRREQDFSAGFSETMKRYSESLTPLKQGAALAESVYSNMGSSLDNFVETGKFKFGDFAKSVIQDLLKIQLRAAATQLFSSILGTFGFPLPGRAAGGPVLAGQPYIVGERGPEVFLPASAGNIVPNNKLSASGGGGIGGGSTTIINNISAIDAKGVAQLFAENRQILFGNVEQARRELPVRIR
jgi:lambda family phage tail tape measure protein